MANFWENHIPDIIREVGWGGYFVKIEFGNISSGVGITDSVHLFFSESIFELDGVTEKPQPWILTPDSVGSILMRSNELKPGFTDNSVFSIAAQGFGTDPSGAVFLFYTTLRRNMEPRTEFGEHVLSPSYGDTLVVEGLVTLDRLTGEFISFENI
jgi:hypothetical protein